MKPGEAYEPGPNQPIGEATPLDATSPMGGGISVDPASPEALLASTPTDPASIARPAGSQKPIANHWYGFKRWLWLPIAAALVITAAITGWVLWSHSNDKQLHTVVNSSDFNQTSLPNNLGSSSLSTGKTSASGQQIDVNGQLNINDQIILAPIDRPANPVSGEIYLDKTTQTLYFYDGSGYVAVAGAGFNPVQSIQGQTGPISFVAGKGISINGTTFNNSGVLSLQGLNGSLGLTSQIGGVTFGKSGNNIVINLPQDLRVSANPSFNSVNLSAVTFTAGGRTFVLPNTGDPVQTICTSGITCVAGGGVAVAVGPDVVQTNTNGNPTIFLDDVGGGKLVQIRSNGDDKFVVDNSGNTTIGSGGNGTLTAGAVDTNAINPSADLGIGNVLQKFTLQGDGSSTIISQANGHNTTIAFQGSGANDITYYFDTSAAAGSHAICTDANAGACLAASGVVTTPGGTVGSLAKFTASGILESSNINDNGTTVTVNAPLSVNSIASSGGPLSVGASTLAFTIQGSASSTLAATDSGHTTTLSFVTPSGNNSIKIPDSSGTLVTSTLGPLYIDTTTGRLTIGANNTGAISPANGGTGLTTANPADGKILIGNGTGFALNPLTAGNGITIDTHSTDNTVPAGNIKISVTTCSTCAKTDLSNLVSDGSLAVNTNLQPAAWGSTVSVGTAAKPFQYLYLFGDSTHSGGGVKLTVDSGTAGTQTIVLPNNSGTVAVQAEAPLNLDVHTGDLSITGILSVGHGGTNTNAAIGPAGSIAYSDGSKYVFTSGAGTTNQLLASTGGTAPTFTSITSLLSAASGGNITTLGSGATATIGVVNNPNFTTSVTTPTLNATHSLSISSGTSTGDTLTLGATSQQFTLQGNQSSIITATDGGGNVTKVGFSGAASGNVTYNFDSSATPGIYTICTEIGGNSNCTGASGGVSASAGTSGVIPVFTNSGPSFTIGNSLLSQSGGNTVAIAPNVNSAFTSVKLGAGFGATHASTGQIVLQNAATTNTVTIRSPNGTGSLASGNLVFTLPDTAGASGSCLTSDGSGVLSFTASSCLVSGGGTGSGVTKLDGINGDLILDNSNGFGTHVTIADAKADSSTKGIATFDGNFTATAGVISTTQGLTTSANDSFNSLSLIGASPASAALTLGNSSNPAIALFTTAGGNIISVKADNSVGSNTTIHLPDSSGTVAVGVNSPLSFTTATSGIIQLGTVPIGKGGTGITTVPSLGQLLAGNSTSGYTVANLTSSNSTVTIDTSTAGTIDLKVSGVGGTGVTTDTSTNLGYIPVYDPAGNSSIGQSIIKQSGSALTIAGTADFQGNLTVDDGNSIIANKITHTTSGKNITIDAGNDGISFIANGITYTLPTGSATSPQVICTQAVSCASGGGSAVLLDPAVPEDSLSSGSSILINKTVASGDLLELTQGAHNAGVDKFVVAYNGATTIQNGLTVQNGGATIANNITVQGGGITVTGNSTIAGTLGSLTGLSSSGTVTFSGLASSGGGVVTANTAGALSLAAIIPVGVGGTGVGSFTTGDLLVGNGINPVATTLAGTTGQLLQSNGGSSVPSFHNITDFLTNGSNIATISAGTTASIAVVNNPTFSGTVTTPTLASTGALAITPGTTGLTAGATTLPFTLQGNQSSVVTATDSTTDHNITKLAFTGTPTSPGTVTFNFNDTTAPGSYDICTKQGNCTGLGGGVTTSTIGNVHIIPVYNSALNDGSIGQSILTQTASDTNLQIAGTGVFQGSGSNATLTLGMAGPSGKNGSLVFQNSFNSNTIKLQSPTGSGAGGAPSSPIVLTLPNTAGGSGSCLISDGSGNLSFTSNSCLTSGGGVGSGVTTLDTINGDLILDNSAHTSSTHVTINNALADDSTEGITAFNNSDFTNPSTGVIDTVQGIAHGSNVQFATGLLTGASALTLGTSSSNDGTILFKTHGSDITLTADKAPGSPITIHLPTTGGTIATSATSPLTVDSTTGAISFNAALTPQYGGTGLNASSASNGSILIGNGSGLVLNPLTAGTGIVIDTHATDGTIPLGNIKISAPNAGSCTSCALTTLNNVASVAIQDHADLQPANDGQVNLGSGTKGFGGVYVYSSGSAVGASAELIAAPQSTGETFALPDNAGANNICIQQVLCMGYAPSTGSANYLAKGAHDTSSATYLGNLYDFTNANTGAAGVLSLTNSGTSSALSVVESGSVTGNLTANQALIFANNTGSAPGGNLIDLQAGGTGSKFHVDVSGNGTFSNNLTVSGNLINTNTFSSSALTFGSSVAGADTIQSVASAALNITGNASSTISTSAGDLSLGSGSNKILLGTTNTINSNVALGIGTGGASGNPSLYLDTTANAYFGNGKSSATPTNFTIQGTDGLGSNITGATLSIAGGQGTGTGIGGGINFQVSKAGGTGSTLNGLVTNPVLVLAGGVGTALFQNAVDSPTAFQVQNANGSNTTLLVDNTHGTGGRVGINTSAASTDLAFGQIAGATTARTIGVETQTTLNIGGNGLTISAGQSNGSGTGGALTLQGGSAAGAGSAGGSVAINGANGSSTIGGGAGGNVAITAGNAQGNVTTNNAGGNITLKSGSAIGTGAIGGVYVQNATDSTNAFVVQNVATNAVLAVSTSTDRVTINASALLQNLADSNNALTVKNATGSNTIFNIDTLNDLIDTPFVTSGSANSNPFNLQSGSITSGATGTSGTISLASGASTTSGDTGAVSVTTGAANSGNSGTITINTGTASGTVGAINIGTNIATNKVINIGSVGSTVGATTVNIATTSDTTQIQGINIGSSTNASNAVTLKGGTGSTAIQLQTGSGGTIGIGNNAVANTINIANANGANNTTVAIGSGVTGVSNTASVTIGSANAAASTTLIQGGNGTGAISLAAAASGSINVGTNAVNGKIINIGSVGSTIGDTTIHIGDTSDTTKNQVITIGSTTASGSTTTVNGGTGTTSPTLLIGTSTTQHFIVPANDTTIAVVACGGSGAGSPNLGGCVSTTVSVTPGAIIYYTAGGAGTGTTGGTGGTGGGAGGNSASAGGGGGSSDVRMGADNLASRIVVAGGGGGNGCAVGGNGGGNGIANGTAGVNSNPSTGGGGGTQSAGGAGGTSGGGAGSLGNGGVGAGVDAGGGGGGFWGGGGAGSNGTCGSGGGGGSSTVVGAVGTPVYTLSGSAGAGSVYITYTSAPSTTINLQTGATGGAAGTIQIGNTAGTNTQTINIGNNATPSSSTSIVIGSTVAGTTMIQGAGGVKVTLGSASSGTNALCTSLANGTNPTAGIAYTLQDCSSTPAADYAEEYPAVSGVTVGDVVMQGSKQIHTYATGADGNVDWTKVKGDISQVVPATTPYATGMIGIVSDNNSDFSSTGYNIKSTDNPLSVALNGRVLVNVTDENGPIVPGDFLTASATKPGYAMKATQAGYVIGQALSSFTSDTPGQVMVFVGNQYYPGPTTGSTIQNGSDGTLSNLNVTGTTDVADLNVSGTATLATLTVTGTTNLDDLVVHGTAIFNGTLSVNGHIITGNVTGTTTATAGPAACAAPTVTVSGNDTSGTVTITTGSGCPTVTTPSTLATVKFASAYANAPKVVLTPAEPNAAKLQYFTGTSLPASFTIDTDDVPANTTTYKYNYLVVQ